MSTKKNLCKNCGAELLPEESELCTLCTQDLEQFEAYMEHQQFMHTAHNSYRDESFCELSTEEKIFVCTR